jgi:tol-pal system protein YbgF
MLGIAIFAKMPPPMIRSIPFVVVALACALPGGAARAQISQSDLLTRIDRLESTIRELTGSVEQLRYRNQQLEQQVQRLQEEVQPGARPQAAAPPRPTGQYSPPPATPLPPPAPVIAAAPPPPPPAPIEQEPPSNRRGDAFNPALNPNAPGVPRPLGASTAATEPPPPPPQVADAPPAAPGARQQPGAPLDLSRVSAPPPAAAAPGGAPPPPPPINPSATGAMQATLPPGSTPKDEYDLGYGYIQHKDYATAAETFTDFLRKYPSDRMAPDAQYWLGEALFQSQRYRDAAEAFLAVSTKYETTARAPDALLRLGMSLAALGEKEAACASLGEVLRKYPRASLSVKQGVDREQKRAHC